jgi:hypothetical protein
VKPETKEHDSETSDEKNDELDELDEFDVHAIKRRRIDQGKVEYLVAWEGYGPDWDTWEPECHLSCDLKLAEFNARVMEPPPLQLPPKRSSRMTIWDGKRH